MPDDRAAGLGDKLFVPRLPSRFHDEARRRSPNHDRMQIEVLDFLRSRKLVGLPDTGLIDRTVEGEYPIIRRGQVVSFVDAIEILEIDLRKYVSAFEIKPKIDSVFAIVRQAKATLALLQSTLRPAYCVCHVVVPHTDPLLLEMRAAWPQTWAWGLPTKETLHD